MRARTQIYFLRESQLTPRMPKKYFEDFEIGDSTESQVSRMVSEHDVRECAALQGSYSEIHMSNDNDTKWDKPLVQGSLLSVIMIGLAKRLPWEPKAAGLYGFDTVRFVNPVFHNDTVNLEVEVVEKEEYDDDFGKLTFKEELRKEDNTLAVTRERIFLVNRYP